MSEDYILETQNLRKTYLMGKVEVYALRGVDLKVERGDFLAIMGPSGAGKSTLLNLLGLLDTPTAGKLMINGKDVSGLGENEKADFRLREIGFVFQFFNLIPELTALENVMFPMMLARRKGNLKKRTREVLLDVGLRESLHSHLPTELSGGEQQRVAVARSLINDPSIILLDEPTGDLDVKSTREVVNLLKTINKEKSQTIVMVTHEPNVGRAAEKITYIEDGRVKRTEMR
ncbi:MAG: ABC transporter ATP-binding protein [Candidatus Methanofastidiosia archaeon]